MKAKIISHNLKMIDTENGSNRVLYMTYEYKGFTSTVSIIDIEEEPSEKTIKQYIKTAEKAINEELKKKADSENKLKKEMKAKQEELNEMRKFVSSRGYDEASLHKAIKEFKNLKK